MTTPTQENIKAPSICIAVCDWRQTGVHDLIISSGRQTFFLENIGSNREPAYRRPAPIKEPDGTIIDISAHEMHVAAFDWDEDGRPDLMIGGEAGTIYLFHRDWISGLKQKVSLGEMKPTVQVNGSPWPGDRSKEMRH